MAKAAKKTAAKPAAKTAAKAKPEKKAAAPKKAVAPKKEAKKEVPVEEIEELAEAPVAAPKISKKEKAAKAAADKLLTEEAKKWNDLKEKHGHEKASPYNMTATFEANKPIQHKVLGWGFIISNQNDRLEVLFETGTKMLISNYKPS